MTATSWPQLHPEIRALLALREAIAALDEYEEDMRPDAADDAPGDVLMLLADARALNVSMLQFAASLAEVAQDSALGEWAA